MKYLRLRTMFVFLVLFQLLCAISTAQGQHPPIVQRANADLEQGNYEQAAALYQDALDHPPPEYGEMPAQYKSYLCANIGICFVKLQRFEMAIAALNQGVSFDPKNAWAYGWLGVAYNFDEKFAEAIPNCQKAIELSPDECSNYAGLALANNRLGQYDAAQQAIDAGRGKTCARDDKQLLENSQLEIYLAKRMYVEANRAVGERKLIGVDLRAIAGIVQIRYVFPNGPAQLAGLQAGDVVMAIDEKPVDSIQTFSTIIDGAPPGSTLPFRVTRNGSVVEGNVIIGIPANLPELAAAANSPAPAAPSPPTVSPSPPTAAPRILTINRVDVKPSTVAPGERFSLEVSYTAPAKSTVSFSYSIRSGQQKLFTSGRQMLEGGSPEAMVIKKTLTATKTPGNYTIEVQMSSNEARAAREAALTVEPRK